MIDRVALAAAAGNNLYLFYSKSDGGIYYRRFDGARPGARSRRSRAASATPLQGALASIEFANGCSLGLAWTKDRSALVQRHVLPRDRELRRAQHRRGRRHGDGHRPGSFEMSFNAADGRRHRRVLRPGGGPDEPYDLVGGVSIGTDVPQLRDESAGDLRRRSTDTRGARLDLLEATPTRVRVRQETF